MTNLLSYLEEACNKYPDKAALSMEEGQLTFSELRTRARQMGAVVSERAAGPGVGVFANRSMEPAVWFLAVLYSGKFYVPLDPDLPAQKLRAIVEDAGLDCVIGNDSNQTRLDEIGYSGCFVTAADAAGRECAFPQTGDDDPAYMVYTSGSTGKPKGVLKSHGAVAAYIEAFCRTFPFSSEEVIGNQTPFFFDASAKDFYLMLKTGATLDVIPSERFALPTELMDYLNAKRITFACWVPTAISLVAQLNPFSLVKPNYLRRLFFVGEVMPMKHLNKWREALPQVQYVNLYGQSELAGVCCYYEVKGQFEPTAVLPMGRPLDHCRIYLLDGQTMITEPGKIGEMYLVSPSLALEYYNDPEKTAQSFLTKDFGSGPVRCFKTGDFAQYDAEGNLIFAARSDFQIKHMGRRIELGEIEAAAGALPEIGRCCCLYHAAKRKIVLYCQLMEGCQSTPREIQSQLRQKLSSYMVPGKVIVLEKLPLNPNGKIDRQKLKEEMLAN